jgi:hypothetical protein
MTEIEKVKGEIKVLQAKLSLLEEMENYRTPAEEAFKKVFNHYPNEKDFREGIWFGFEKGYNVAQEEKEKEQKWDVVRESVKWCEENPEKSVEDYLTPQGPQGPVGPGPGPKGVIVGYEPTPQERGDRIHKEVENEIEKLQEKNWYVDAKTLLKSNWEPKPQTPEQVDAGLRTAMRQAKKDGVFDEPTKPMNEVLDRLENKWNSATENTASYITDEVVNRMLKKWEENPPEFLKFELGETLETRIYKWWTTCYSKHWTIDECTADLLDIVELFLPREQSAEGSQNINTEVAVEAHNELLQKIKSKLRNKK